MRGYPNRVAIWCAVLLGVASSASADLAKLDRRAHAALVSLRARADVAALREQRMAVTAAGQLDVFIRGDIGRAELEAAGAVVRTALPGLFTAFLPLDAVERVAALPGVTRIRGAAPVALELDVSVPAIGVSALRGAGPQFTGANGQGVLIGAVDSGVDYQHGDFEDENGNTRLIRIWDQSIDVGASPPAGYSYGTEWTQAQIDAGTCPSTDGIGHGTHVFGVAAGDGSQTGNGVPAYTYAGVAPRADLVMVKSDFDDTHVVDGVAYVFSIAQARGQSAVVNVSLGSQYGPHDGTSDFETGLNALSGPGRIVVKSAGNDRGSSSHAEVSTLGGNASVTMTVNGSAAGAQFAIVGFYEASDNHRIQVTTPSGTNILVNRGSVNQSWPGQDTPNGNVYVENGFYTTTGGDWEVYIEVAVATGDNMNGTWTMTFMPLGSPAVGEIDLWRFYTSPTVTSVFTSGAQNEELISEPGNADSVITVAGWTTRRTWITCQGSNLGYTNPVPTLGEVAWFSSPGPTRDGRQKPDITAPGAGIASTNSFDAFPACGSNASFLLNDGANHRIDQGTSMAAPHVTGAVALLLQSFGALPPRAIKNHLVNHASLNGTGAVWNKDYGWGKLFLDQSVDALLSLFYAELGPEGVTLRWRFGDPSQFTSVSLQRAISPDGPWYPVDAELRLEEGATVALDRATPAGITSYYRLVAARLEGGPMIFGPLEVASAASPRFELRSAWPNPTRDATRIDFVVPRAAPIRLVLFDVQGREVTVLASGIHRPGRYQAVWNGTNGVMPAPSGIYFLRLETPDGPLTQRVAVAR